MSTAEHWLSLLLPLEEDVRRQVVIELLKSLDIKSDEIKFNCRKCGASVSFDNINKENLCYFCEELRDQHVHEIYHRHNDARNYCRNCSEVWECKGCRSVENFWGHADTHVAKCSNYYWCCGRYYMVDGPAHR